MSFKGREWVISSQAADYLGTTECQKIRSYSSNINTSNRAATDFPGLRKQADSQVPEVSENYEQDQRLNLQGKIV